MDPNIPCVPAPERVSQIKRLETLTSVLVNKISVRWAQLYWVIFSLTDDTRGTNSVLSSLPSCSASEANPPEFTACHLTSAAPLPRRRESLRHFKIIFPVSNFTLGYTQVEQPSF